MGIETASPHFYVSAAEDVTGRTPIQLLEMLESDLPWHFFETEVSLWRSARYSAGIDRVSATESSLVMERAMGIETASRI